MNSEDKTMKLSNWKIQNKLFLLLGVLTSIVVAVSAIGSISSGDLAEDGQAVSDAGTQSTQGARLQAPIYRLNRLEYVLIAEPSAENISKIVAERDQEKKEFEGRMETLKKTADAKQGEMLAAV